MNLQASVSNYDESCDGESEWFGHALIARNICPLHEDQPADACDHGCTWFMPEPSTEEPERTLTAVERNAEPVPYDATVEDRHEHGFTFREGLGYLAIDPECSDCCLRATWAAQTGQPATDAEQVTADVDAKTAEAEEL